MAKKKAQNKPTKKETGKEHPEDEVESKAELSPKEPTSEEKPSEEKPSEEKPSEETPSEEKPSEETPSEETLSPEDAAAAAVAAANGDAEEAALNKEIADEEASKAADEQALVDKEAAEKEEARLEAESAIDAVDAEAFAGIDNPFVLNRDKVVISTTGHTVNFEADVPCNVPKIMEPEVQAVGASRPKGYKVEKPKAAPVDTQTREEKIRKACELLVAENDGTKFTANNFPMTEVLNQMTGLTVENNERDTIYQALKDAAKD